MPGLINNKLLFRSIKEGRCVCDLRWVDKVSTLYCQEES